MLEWLNTIIGYDKQLLIFLHSQGSLFWDNIWLSLTNPLYWIPLFFLLFFLGLKAFGLKKALLIALFTAIGAATALTIVNLIKNYFQRLRPINDLSINNNIRLLIESNDFSSPRWLLANIVRSKIGGQITKMIIQILCFVAEATIAIIGHRLNLQECGTPVVARSQTCTTVTP